MPTLLRPQDHLAEALNWRYATKQFDPNAKISAEDWALLKDSLRLAPSSYGLQPWRFIDVQDPGLRARLRGHTWGQAQVTDASHYLVLTYLKKLDAAFIGRHVERTAQVRGLAVESLARFRQVAVDNLVDGPRAAGIREWARHQAYIAMGFGLLAAAELKIDACPIEGLDQTAYDRELGLTDGPWATAATIAFGYRAESDKYGREPKVRFSDADVFETR